MENRTLDIDPDAPGFVYKYPVCVAHFLFVCTRYEQHKDSYDLRDNVVRKQLIDTGFVLRKREL